jgi:hypothetical protein
VLQRYLETGCGATPTPTATLPPGTPTPTATLPLGTPPPTATPPPGAPTPTVPPGSACLGDCDNDRTVSVSDLVRGVSIALALQPLSACPGFGGNNDGRVSVNELVAAVGNALGGCP